MMKFNCSNIKGDNPMWSRLFIIGGDGESTTLKVALQASPVGMEFRGGKMPSQSLFHGTYEGPELASLSCDYGFLTIEFIRPLAYGEWVQLPVGFYYEGEV